MTTGKQTFSTCDVRWINKAGNRYLYLLLKLKIKRRDLSDADELFRDWCISLPTWVIDSFQFFIAGPNFTDMPVGGLFGEK